MSHLNRKCIAVGQNIGEYIIEKILGQGGFAVTYLVKDPALQKRFALKEFYPIGLCSRKYFSNNLKPINDLTFEYKSQKDKFISEARVLASFSHPNICNVARVFEENNTAYILMEYLNGRNLTQLIEDTEIFSEVQIRELLVPIIEGLSTIHLHGLIHRDIKPDNIYIKDDGTPILIDFGAARNYKKNDGLNMSIILTPQFAPIEQFDNIQKQGQYSDIYSLGCVLYTIVTGLLPIPAIRRSEGVKMQTAQELCAGKYSDVLLRAIDLAMQIEPHKRPQTIEEFKYQLGGFCFLLNHDHVISNVACKICNSLIIWAVEEFNLQLNGWEALVFAIAFPASDITWRLDKQFDAHGVWQECKALLKINALVDEPNLSCEGRSRIIVGNPDLKSLFYQRFQEYSAAYLLDRKRNNWDSLSTVREQFLRNIFPAFNDNSVRLPDGLCEWATELIIRSIGRCKKALEKRDPRWGESSYPLKHGRPVASQ